MAAMHAAALDACAMAQDNVLAESLVYELPDPFDHIGRRVADQPPLARVSFERARGIDQQDTTALRGLADAEDRQAGDSARTEDLFRQVLTQEPHDAQSHVRLVGVLLAAGRPRAAIEAYESAAVAVTGVLDDASVAKRLLIPIARDAIAAGNLPLASRAASAARQTISAPEALELDRLVNALVETLEYGEFVGPDRLGTAWWRSPEVLADLDKNRCRLVRWLAARAEEINGTKLTLHCADVVLPPNLDERPPRIWTGIELEELEALSLDDLPDVLPGAILEIGFYGELDAEGSTVVRLIHLHDITLPESDLPLDRYTVAAT
jgi:hypothetical protein